MRLPQEDFCQALGVAPAIKYESDGGPGIHDGMKFLLGSQEVQKDRETFFKAQILFWLMAQGSLASQKAKMAMSVKSRNRHYRWDRIQPRHFISTAHQVGFSRERASELLNEIAEQVPRAISAVEALLPVDFPSRISESILDGVKNQAKKIK